MLKSAIQILLIGIHLSVLGGDESKILEDHLGEIVLSGDWKNKTLFELNLLCAKNLKGVDDFNVEDALTSYKRLCKDVAGDLMQANLGVPPLGLYGMQALNFQKRRAMKLVNSLINRLQLTGMKQSNKSEGLTPENLNDLFIAEAVTKERFGVREHAAFSTILSLVAREVGVSLKMVNVNGWIFSRKHTTREDIESLKGSESEYLMVKPILPFMLRTEEFNVDVRGNEVHFEPDDFYLYLNNNATGEKIKVADEITILTKAESFAHFLYLRSYAAFATNDFKEGQRCLAYAAFLAPKFYFNYTNKLYDGVEKENPEKTKEYFKWLDNHIKTRDQLFKFTDDLN